MSARASAWVAWPLCLLCVVLALTSLIPGGEEVRF